MESRGRDPATPLLLVRRAVVAGEPDVAALLRALSTLWKWLTDAAPPGTRPQRPRPAVAVGRPSRPPPFALHRPAGAAQLAGIAVPVHLRRRGFGHRPLTGALMWLRAEGVERAQAHAAPGGAAASLLASAGFTADPSTDQTDGRIRLVLLL